MIQADEKTAADGAFGKTENGDIIVSECSLV